MNQKMITFALPKGRLLTVARALLQDAGLMRDHLDDPGRRLISVDEEAGLRYLICRPADVPTFVENGAADLGITGKDVILEQDREICELLDLRAGGCRFVVAVSADRRQDFAGGLPGYVARFGPLRVATKFPRIARSYMYSQGLPGEIIKLSGNVELAPLVGLADVIIDLVSSGRTMQENNLVPVVEIAGATARLVANRVAYRLQYDRLAGIVDAIRTVIRNQEPEAGTREGAGGVGVAELLG
jgi:ATP phosphoribosyltransferase